ncbi:hypothetical protein ACFLYL_01110 [Chloroflexota bacterium]
MAYSKQVKQRAIELSKICSSAAQVLTALAREFDADQIPMDERTVRRWLKGQDVSYLKNMEEHDAMMTDIANILLEQDLSQVHTILNRPDMPNCTYLVVGHNLPPGTEITHRQLLGRIEGNLTHACHSYSTWHVLKCFFAHFESEWPESKEDLWGFMETNTSAYVDALRIMSERKTFKGTCPVFKDWI